jgi:hypothetical protein
MGLLMSGAISIAFAVVGWALFRVTVLSIFGLFAIGLGWAEGADAVPADPDRPANRRLPPSTR